MMEKEGQTGVTAISGAGKKTAIPQKKIIITERRLNRMKARMAETAISQSALAVKIGVSPSAISFVLSGKTHRTQYFPAIAEALGVDLDWLLGKRDGEYDEDQLELGQHLESGAQETVALLPEIDLLGRYAERLKGIPLTGRRYAYGRSSLDQYGPANPANLVVAEGVGDAMTPTLFDTDRLFIDTSRRQLDSVDAIWLVRFAGLLVIRRIRARSNGLRLIADNPLLPDDDVASDEVEFLGRLVGFSRRV